MEIEISLRAALRTAAATTLLALIVAALINVMGSRSGPAQAADFISAGISAQQAGNLNTALDDYRHALAHDPRNYLAWYDLGTVHQAQQQKDFAEGDYSAALQWNPQYVAAIFNLAILETPDYPQAAANLYLQAIAITPNDPSLHLNLGYLYISLNQLQDARAQFAIAVRLDPSLLARVPVPYRPTS